MKSRKRFGLIKWGRPRREVDLELVTGTGTDQIIMASGYGEKCTYVGGHTKIGEMIARAVTSSTVNAIKKSANGYFGA